MSSAIVLPNLTNWTEQHIKGLYNPSSQQEFDDAFDNTFAKHCNITVNGVHLSRDQYKQQIRGEEFLEASADIKFDGAVEVPKDQNQPTAAGLVGVFFEATIYKKLLVLGAEESSKVTSSLNVIIEQDKSLQQPTGPIHGFFDGRRIATLNQVFIDKTNPVSLPTAS